MIYACPVSVLFILGYCTVARAYASKFLPQVIKTEVKDMLNIMGIITSV